MSVFFRRFQLSRDIGIDLGTANTLIYVSGRAIALLRDLVERYPDTAAAMKAAKRLKMIDEAS